MPDHIPTPQKPCEVICFYPIEIPTRDEGNVYLFIAVDVVSTYLFKIGAEKTNDIKAVLQSIKQLMEEGLFNKNKGNTFTLVLHKYKQYKEQIEAVIKPFGGTAAFNDAYVAQVVTPPMQFLFERMARR